MNSSSLTTNTLAILLLFSVSANVCGAAEKPMNVLMLIADDLNSWLLEDPERYAGKVIAPNLKALAESGVNFKCAYTAAPVCSPSRTALFSGVAPWKSGIYNNAQTINESKALSKDDVLSLAGLFKKNGYDTFGYGKITHGWDQKQYWNEHVGHKRDPAPPGAPLAKLSGGEQDWGIIHITEEQMNDTRGADKAIAVLEKQHDKPFFLAYGSFNPHMPWYVPQKYFDMYPLDQIVLPELKDDDLDDLPPLARAVSDGPGSFADKVIKSGKHKEAVQAYLATTTYVDTQIGRVLDALENSPYKDNTIVVFLTDHGLHLGEKLHWQKTTLWEEGTHTLLMFCAPGVTSAGGVSERFVSLMDIYPRVPTDRVIDGKDIWPVIAVKDGAKSPHEAIYYLRGRGVSGIRMDDWKYLIAPAKEIFPEVAIELTPGEQKLPRKQRNALLKDRTKAAQGKQGDIEMLFNLREDLGEERNMIDQHTDIAARLKSRMKTFEAELKKTVRPAGTAE